MDYNLLRQELDILVKTKGIKYRFIAEQCDINESYFCAWRKGREYRQMNEESYNKLKEFIQERM